MTYTTEIVHRIFNDDTGEHIDVGPDADGLDHIEVRFVDSDGEIGSRLSGPFDQMRLVAEAILKLTGRP